MDYLSSYYKNLSEQLQDKVNFLERTLNEIRAYTDAERQDEKLASRDIRAAKKLKTIAAKFVAKKEPENKFLSPEDEQFGDRLINMLRAKGIESKHLKVRDDTIVPPGTFTNLQTYGPKGVIQTPIMDKDGNVTYDSKYTKITDETPMSMTAENEKNRELGATNAEYHRQQKFKALREKQKADAEAEAKKQFKSKFTI